MQITGADLFVKALKEEQVRTLFAYPGGQAIDLFDALYKEQDMEVILPRHEQGLIHAADGYARSTGRVGVCLVTSGPGAANLVTGDGGMQMNIQELATAVVYELPIIICILNNGYLGNMRQWQELFYGRRYSSTCMRYRKSCPPACERPGENCPDYTPDFVRLAQSYGAKGIRVTESDAVEDALRNAKQNEKGPVVIEFIIDREANVMPIVPPGKPLYEMITGKENLRK